MSVYIDKQAALKALDKACRRYPSTFYNGLSIAADIVQKMPAADVVEVVRCRECGLADAYGHCEMQNFWGTRDDYCSRGRKLTNG